MSSFFQLRLLLLLLIVGLASTFGVRSMFVSRVGTATSITASNLSISIKKSAPAVVQKGSTATFRVEVSNRNIISALRPTVYVDIPPSLGIDARLTSPECVLQDSSRIVCTGPSSIESNETWETAVSLLVPSAFKREECPGYFTVWASVTSATQDVYLVNNTAGATIAAECTGAVPMSSGASSVAKPQSSVASTASFASSGQASSARKSICRYGLCNPGTELSILTCSNGGPAAGIFCPDSGCLDDITQEDIERECKDQQQSSIAARPGYDLAIRAFQARTSNTSDGIAVLTLDVLNVGDTSAKPSVSFTLPPSIQYVYGDIGGILCNAAHSLIQCEHTSSIAPTASKRVTVLLKPALDCPLQGSVVARIPLVIGNTADAHTQNNTASVVVRINCSSTVSSRAPVRSSAQPNAASEAVSRPTSAASYAACPNAYRCTDIDTCKQILQTYQKDAQPTIETLCAANSICCVPGPVKKSSASSKRNTDLPCELQPQPLTMQCAYYCLETYGNYDCKPQVEPIGGGDGGGEGDSSQGTSQDGGGSSVARTCTLPYRNCTLGEKFTCPVLPVRPGSGYRTATCTSGCILTGCVPEGTGASSRATSQAGSIGGTIGGDDGGGDDEGGGSSQHPCTLRCSSFVAGQTYKCSVFSSMWVDTVNGKRIYARVHLYIDSGTCSEGACARCPTGTEAVFPNPQRQACGDGVWDQTSEECDYSALARWIDPNKNNQYKVCTRECRLQ